MKSFYKILLIIIAIAYLISPVDLIPDFMIPYVGWLDDIVVLWLIFYFIKFNRMPSFFYRQKKTGQYKHNDIGNDKNSSFSNDYSKRKQYENHGYGNTKKNNNNQGYGDNYRNTHGEKNTNFQNKKSKKSPYEVLGLDKNATEKEIRAAYRKLVKQYHPDRVASLGKELQDLANKKFIEIKDAYNSLMRS